MDYFNNVLTRGAPISIFEADRRSQKAVSAYPITDTDFLKPFYNVELFIVMIQSRFVDIY